MKDIIITIPKKIAWTNYQKELDRAFDGEVMNFKVSNFPKTCKGKRCYVVHDGYIRGYMIISKLSEKSFKCTTTGKVWAGKFIERTGKFFSLDCPIKMRGFQGFRYVK